MCKKFTGAGNGSFWFTKFSTYYTTNYIISIYSLDRLLYEESTGEENYITAKIYLNVFSNSCDGWLVSIKHNYYIIMHKSYLWNYNYWGVILRNITVTVMSQSYQMPRWQNNSTWFIHYLVMSNIIKLYKRLPFIYSLRLMSGTAIQIRTSLCTTFTMSEKFYNTRCNRNI